MLLLLDSLQNHIPCLEIKSYNFFSSKLLVAPVSANSDAQVSNRLKDKDL